MNRDHHNLASPGTSPASHSKAYGSGGHGTALAAIVCLVLLFNGCSAETKNIIWTQDHITDVPSIMMKDPFLEFLGQTDGPLLYTYEEAVKLAGHSCGAVAGAWIITKKSLEMLYPDEVPRRGQIIILAPGAEDEWLVGVFAEVMTYVTGAAPKTGFPGASFCREHKRRNLLQYKDAPANTPPPQMTWIFKRTDTGAQVSAKYDLSLTEPPATPEFMKLGGKVANGQATSEETAQWTEFWNARVEFVFENADSLEGLFTVTDLGAPTASSSNNQKRNGASE